MKKWLCTAFALLLFWVARAQFNDSIHHYIRYAGTGSFNKTNDNRSYLLNNLLRYSLRKKNKSFNFNSSYIFGKQQEDLTNSDFTSSIDFNVRPKDSSKIYSWGTINYVKSYSLNINGRFQAGLGGGYNFVDNAKRWINISEGVLYESSDLKLTDSTNNKYTTLRNSLWLRFRFVIGGIITLDSRNNIENSLKDQDDYIIGSTNTLSLKLRRWLNLTSAVAYNRVNLTGRYNLLITFGLTAETYF